MVAKRRRVRNYAAEYDRRIEKGRRAGLTRQQARGHRPAEHVARKRRLATVRPGPGRMAGWQEQQFSSLRQAWTAGSRLPAFSVSFVTARGHISVDSPRPDEDPGSLEWRSLTSAMQPDAYDEYGYDLAKRRIAELFIGVPSRYGLWSKLV